ncbi:MAG: glycosyltransferase family 4 protein [Candidatus Brockarchaeota archaeon]|nr:glycosyltransferase family 4 protein [Candidatus Brockarchaeota archaeon]MBO3768534.1 glycosyltransferase family 4 protein [Candidatus Brockarchaeota archaeon]
MKKIVIYHPFLSVVGGAEQVIRNLAEYLATKNTVRIISHDEHRIDIPNVEFTSIEVLSKRFNLISSVEVSKKIKKALKENSYDILITSNAPPIIDYLISKKEKGNVLHFCWCHEPRRSVFYKEMGDTNKSEIKTNIKAEIYKKFYIRAYKSHYDKIIVYSEFIRNILKKKLNINGNKITKIPWGINVKSIDWKPLTESKKILYVGRINEAKNTYRLIRAMKMVKKDFRDSKLAIVGPIGDLEEKRFFNELKEAGDAVEYLGVKVGKELQKMYEEAQVVVYPVINEPWGLVPLEAMANARAVVVGTGGPRETVEDGITGLYVDPFNVKDIAEKITNLLADFNLCKTMGINGRKKVEKEFDISKTYSAVSELIERS